LDILSRNIISLLVHFKNRLQFSTMHIQNAPPLSWKPLSLRKQPRKWFQNPLKDLERKWFRLFSKPTLNFKSFEESKLKTTLFQKVLKTRFRKAKVFKRFWFLNLHGFRPEFQKFLQLTLPHWSNQFSKPHVLKSFGKKNLSFDFKHKGCDLSSQKNCETKD